MRRELSCYTPYFFLFGFQYCPPLASNTPPPIEKKKKKEGKTYMLCDD